MMCSAMAIEHRSGLWALQKKGIFSPFCLFFCVLQQMRTEEMLDKGILVKSWTGISRSRKNSKSSAMKTLGGCDGQAVICL